MFHVFASTEGKNIRKQLFLETINSPRCTVRSLLKHSQVAHEIAKDKRFGSVSEMKEIVLKRWPHLKHVVKEMHFMATEPRSKWKGRGSNMYERRIADEAKKKEKHAKKKEKHSKKKALKALKAPPSLLKIALTSLLAAMAVLGGIAGEGRKNYHRAVAKIPQMNPDLIEWTVFPHCGTDDPVEHVLDTLETLGVGTTEYDLWEEAQTNSAALTEAQQAHRGGTSGLLANAFRKIQGSKDANVDSLIAKYAKRFEGDVKQVVIKIGTPSKTNATADAAAFVFLQIIAPLVATAATGWTIKLIHERASGSECPNDDTETIGDLSKKEAFMVADSIRTEAQIIGGFSSMFVSDATAHLEGETKRIGYAQMRRMYG